MANHSEIAAMAVDAALAIVLERESELARLDAVAGDGDHGAGMARGLRAAAEAERTGNAGAVLMQAGTAFSNAAGGASGALVGMFIMTIGAGLQGSDEVEASQLHTALENGFNAIGKLGKAQVGDKTMLDTLSPFIAAFGEAAQAGDSVRAAWEKALPAAEGGMKSTAEMVARRGRSSVLGDKSLGTIDPGAASMYYMLTAIGQVLQDNCPE